jgi:positive regulator of sigma E activity
MKNETKIMIVSELMYFIALLSLWLMFWNMVGAIDPSEWKFWGIMFVVIALIFLRDVKREFDRRFHKYGH